MGIDRHSAQFLLSEKRRGVRFGRMLTLGRQGVHMPVMEYRSILKAFGTTPEEPHFADDFFRGMGADTLDFIDASGYEGANIIHDLNQPIPGALTRAYDIVFDGGALEHVFNFPTALKNCLEMVKVGGHLIIITTWNNYAGHGFYQFSPELFYSALSPDNGYSVERMMIVQNDRWYAVANPKDVGGRVQLVNNEPTLLFLTAVRTELVTLFATWPQQSDYSTAWKNSASVADPRKFGSSLKANWVENLPGGKALQKIWRDHKARKACSLANRKVFRPVEMD